MSPPPPPKKRWATWILGGLLLLQGLGKAAAPAQYVRALAAFDAFPASFLWPVAVAWTAFELASGVGLITAGLAARIPRAARYAAMGAVAVSIGYALLTLRAYLLGLTIANCTCFGAFLAQRLSRFVLAQDGYMLLYSSWQLVRIRRWLA